VAADDRRELEEEAAIFGRYLVGRVPPAELVARYVAANGFVFASPAEAPERALLAFVRQRPWSVGMLDAAAGLRAPAGRLRGKILLLGAILETSPTFADEFLPRPVPPARLALSLFRHGVVAVACAVLGLPLYAMLARTRS
jgi:hypothetical protein